MIRTIGKGGLLTVAVAALCVSVPAQATMGCWNETQVAAAKVRDLQSMLMVATMRCRAMGADITYAYNRFVVANRSTIQGANGVILSQFQSGFGSDGQRQYDRFATQLANAYGGDATDRWICAETEQLADEAAGANGDVSRLVALADSLRLQPSLPGGRCEISFDRVDVEPVSTAAYEQQAQAQAEAQAQATSIPRDRWDEVEAIPAPSADPEDVSAEWGPPPPAPVPLRRAPPAPAKVEGKAGFAHHI